MLLTVLWLTGCSPVANDTEYGSDLPITDSDLYSESDVPQTESSGPFVEEPLRTSRFEFDVASGEHGYLGVQWLEHMNDYLPHRLAFSNRELETAEWIMETLLEIGFDERQVDVQTFHIDTPTSSWWGEAFWGVEWFESMGYYEGLERIDYSQNVILTIPGRTAETIIIGAHYDTVDNPGLSDNASGTVLLLENAYRMRNVDHYYTLQYVFFGAEEIGLIGSFYFADQMTKEEIDNLVLMINVDVIMDGPDLIYAIGYIEDSSAAMEMLWETPKVLQNDLSEQVKGIADQLNTEYRTELISKPHAINLPSDHLAFIEFGIPVMAFYATHPVAYPETFNGDVLHTERDNLDFLMTTHPGRVERALYQFGLFLEEVVSSDFIQ